MVHTPDPNEAIQRFLGQWSPLTRAEALHLANEGDFALVISDVGLPDRTGFELMSELRTLKPGTLGIALSGYGMEDDLVRSQAAGFSVHLVKPVTITMLEEAIATLVLSPKPGPALGVNNAT